MNILHVVPSLDYGGLEKIVYDMIKEESTNNKNKMHLICLGKGGHLYNQLENDIVKKYIFNQTKAIDFGLLFKMIRYIKNNYIDVIHSHSGAILYAAFAGKLCSVKKIIHTDHGRYYPEKKLRILEDRYGSKLIDCYVCVSQEMQHYIYKTVKVKKNKVKLILNGIDTDKYKPVNDKTRLKIKYKYGIAEDTILIGTVCRLIKQKNVEFLIDWFLTYGHNYNNLKLIIAGDGPEIDDLQQKTCKCKDVIFLGHISNTEDIYNILDIFTLTSETEGTSMTILEAMACKVPVVVTDVGGNISLVKNEYNGLLFPLNNLKKFNEQIRSLLLNNELKTYLGENGRSTVKTKHSIQNMLNNYHELYM